MLSLESTLKWLHSSPTLYNHNRVKMDKRSSFLHAVESFVATATWTSKLIFEDFLFFLQTFNFFELQSTKANPLKLFTAVIYKFL
jgi:hypothetical protein